MVRIKPMRTGKIPAVMAATASKYRLYLSQGGGYNRVQDQLLAGTMMLVS
jgi:hypothetical protein